MRLSLLVLPLLAPSLFAPPLLASAATASPAFARLAAQAAPVTPDPAFSRRTAELLGILQGTGDHADFFTAPAAAQLTRATLAAALAPIYATHGAPRAVLPGGHQRSPWSGIVRVQFADGVALVQLVIDSKPPHQAMGLLFKGFEANEATLDQVVGAIAKLPGTTNFALARLGDAAPALLVSHNAQAPLAVGSAFKLVILAELIRSIDAGERRWDDSVARDNAQLPSGGYTSVPVGTRIPLRELATQMISISDNSATDLLLKALGRDKVEAMQRTLGIRDPGRNIPFLSTLEAFKLKYLGDGAHGRRYAALDTAGKRRLLAELAPVPLIAVSDGPDRKPAQIDSLEWFFSPADLVRMMDWLRRNTQGAKGAEARAILAKNPGIGTAAAKWQWVGYKGGSELGVVNLTLLLQARGGDWYALSGSWNNPEASVDTDRFIALITRAAELAAP